MPIPKKDKETFFLNSTGHRPALAWDGTMIDYLDVGVGTASIGTAIFLASNPIGWVIGTCAAVYFTGRLVYDIYEEIND